MLCIYCGEREANAREHYLPQCLGRFQQFDPLLDRICQQCNEQIGGRVERDFARVGPEGLLRSLSFTKGRRRTGRNRRKARIYEPEKIGGRHIRFYALDPNSGREILWQTGEQPGTIREISQIVVLNGDEKIIGHIPIPTDITSGEELKALFKEHEVTFPIAKADVIAKCGDEERVERLFAAIGVPLTLQKRTGGRVGGQQRFVPQITPAYLRALAKIGFHYALKYVPSIVGNELEFGPLREFICKGTGNADQFLTWYETELNPSGRVYHRLCASATPDGEVVVGMQFFVGFRIGLPLWRLRLGDAPASVARNEMSTHAFPYITDGQGRLIGDTVMSAELRPQ